MGLGFLNGNGAYYGIPEEYLSPTAPTQSNNAAPSRPFRRRRPSISDSMTEALQELRSLRTEMEQLQRDMDYLKQNTVPQSSKLLTDSNEMATTTPKQAYTAQQKREFELVRTKIEAWGAKVLAETDGWEEVSCNKMMRGAFNKSGRTRAYMKWMKDSREEFADSNDNTEYPCIKCFSTIDAPLEDVCSYLSQEAAYPEYNDLVEKFKDVEDISPDSKVCWSQSPQILFLKPRDFVTYCHHRWMKDGTQVIVNQACDHPDLPGSDKEGDDKACRAYALRGINLIARHPTDPTKTQISLVAHANPGGNVPRWALKTAVNALAPIEPFKLFHKINENVSKHEQDLHGGRWSHMDDGGNGDGAVSGDHLATTASSTMNAENRMSRPAGMAQLGYACFWPNGGGKQEGRPLPLLGDLDEAGSSSSNSNVEAGTETMVMESPQAVSTASSESMNQSTRSPVGQP